MGRMKFLRQQVLPFGVDRTRRRWQALRRRVPQAVQVVVLLGSESGRYLEGPFAPLNPELHERVVAENQGVLSLARSLPNFLALDLRSWLKTQPFYEHAGHLSHAAYQEIASQLERVLGPA